MMDESSAIKQAKCPYCDNTHNGVCPSVKAFEYHPDGSLKRVEFKGEPDFWRQPGGQATYEPLFKQPPFDPHRFQTTMGGLPATKVRS